MCSVYSGISGKSIIYWTLEQKCNNQRWFCSTQQDNNVRRAVQDLDIDFIKYSLADESIDAFMGSRMMPVLHMISEILSHFF